MTIRPCLACLNTITENFELMTHPYRLLLMAPVFLLGACATTPLPTLPPTHPASPNAPEATMAPIANGLASDEASQKTDALLKGHSAPSENSGGSMSSMPGMKSMPGM